MFARSDKSKFLLTVMLVIAVLAVAIPTCEMVGCDMGMSGGMMGISMFAGPHFALPCNGTWSFSTSQAGIVPSDFSSLIVALFAALAMGVLFFSPMLATRPLFIAEANAPPPPVEPRGERYLL